MSIWSCGVTFTVRAGDGSFTDQSYYYDVGASGYNAWIFVVKYNTKTSDDIYVELAVTTDNGGYPWIKFDAATIE
jgi:hypothetical protein